jgi:hypothetical protein
MYFECYVFTHTRRALTILLGLGCLVSSAWAQPKSEREVLIVNEAGERFSPGEPLSARRGITLHWGEPQAMELAIYDQQGQLVARRHRTASDPESSVFVPLNRWAGHELSMSLQVAKEAYHMPLKVIARETPQVGYQP